MKRNFSNIESVCRLHYHYTQQDGVLRLKGSGYFYACTSRYPGVLLADESRAVLYGV